MQTGERKRKTRATGERVNPFFNRGHLAERRVRRFEKQKEI